MSTTPKVGEQILETRKLRLVADGFARRGIDNADRVFLGLSSCGESFTLEEAEQLHTKLGELIADLKGGVKGHVVNCALNHGGGTCSCEWVLRLHDLAIGTELSTDAQAGLAETMTRLAADRVELDALLDAVASTDPGRYDLAAALARSDV